MGGGGYETMQTEHNSKLLQLSFENIFIILKFCLSIYSVEDEIDITTVHTLDTKRIELLYLYCHSSLQIKSLVYLDLYMIET